MADNVKESDLHDYRNTPQNPLSPDAPSQYCDNELNRSISAWERRAKAAWEDANKAEAEGRWEDWDYYVDLAGLYERMSWNTRIQMGRETEIS